MDLRNEFMPLLRFGQTKFSSFCSVMQRKSRNAAIVWEQINKIKVFV